MANFVLKGRQAEIKIPVTAEFPDVTDTFTAVFKRGNKEAFKEAWDKKDTWTVEEALTDWLLRVEDVQAGDNAEPLTIQAAEILPSILEDSVYSSAVMAACWNAIGNDTLIDTQRLGNSHKRATSGQAAEKAV